MRRLLSIVLFAGMALVQLAAPGYMIYSREMTLAHGEAFRFRCAPVDPYDAFRGRYVAINVPETARSVPVTGRKPAYGMQVYAILAEDEAGFAYYGSVSFEKPAGKPYIKTTVIRTSGNKAILRFPFGRYYMNAYLAPEAEKAYRQNRSGGDTFITVRVRAGSAAPEELYLGGKPVREFLRGGPEDGA
jgi:uncharacterized membrane-anchored protein